MCFNFNGKRRTKNFSSQKVINDKHSYLAGEKYYGSSIKSTVFFTCENICHLSFIICWGLNFFALLLPLKLNTSCSDIAYHCAHQYRGLQSNKEGLFNRLLTTPKFSAKCAFLAIFNAIHSRFLLTEMSHISNSWKLCFQHLRELVGSIKDTYYSYFNSPSIF